MIASPTMLHLVHGKQTVLLVSVAFLTAHELPLTQCVTLLQLRSDSRVGGSASNVMSGLQGWLSPQRRSDVRVGAAIWCVTPSLQTVRGLQFAALWEPGESRNCNELLHG